MTVNASEVNSTAVKEKPVVAPKPRRAISHTSTTPVSRSSTLPHHSSSNSFVSPSTTIRQRAESLPDSESPCRHVNVTASLPHNFNTKSYVEHPVSKHHAVSPHSPVDSPNKNASTFSNRSSPPKVNYVLIYSCIMLCVM